MGNTDSISPPTSVNAQVVLTKSSNGARTNDPNAPPQSPSFTFEDFQRDDSTTIYSFFSTWSSNYTMSNLPGPGRLLGNLLSGAGSSLERRLGKIARRARSRSYAKASTVFLRFDTLRDMIFSEDAKQTEKVCEIFLKYAGYLSCLLHHPLMYSTY